MPVVTRLIRFRVRLGCLEFLGEKKETWTDDQNERRTKPPSGLLDDLSGIPPFLMGREDAARSVEEGC